MSEDLGALLPRVSRSDERRPLAVLQLLVGKEWLNKADRALIRETVAEGGKKMKNSECWVGVDSLGNPNLDTIAVERKRCASRIAARMTSEGDVMLVPLRVMIALRKVDASK